MGNPENGRAQNGAAAPCLVLSSEGKPCYFCGMHTLAEVEFAAEKLPRAQRELLVLHLQSTLDGVPASLAGRAPAEPAPVTWPDYHSRLQTIYGDRAMPSMVLAERETAPW